ncbi:hypothetical protein [Pseudomonas bananamidigenes]|uniref:hypothetical protein n=1 Tax=Pseudomonas bananamidigenes TaxID=2843610 RepID=UPI0008031D5F|nr:hypothetical protein [Pseudomonas bananamidigenes]
MDIQSSMLARLFVLYPVIIQGWVSPVKPPAIADGGIPKSIYDDQPKGLECLVDPWAELQMRSSTMAVDDRVDLYVNDETNPVTGHTVKAGEEQLRIALYVPHGRLRHGVNRLHYKVKRASGNGSEDSRDLNVLYHLRLADGLELLFPPAIIEKGVGAEDARKGVELTFKYNNRRPFDRIRCLIGDATFDFDVPDAPAPITKTLFTDIFEQAGDHPNSIVEFQVFDQLGNVVASSQHYLDIHLNREEPQEPFVEDFDSTPTTIINPGGTISLRYFDVFYASGEAFSQVAIAPATGLAQGEIKGQALQPSYGVEAPYTSTVQIQLRLKIPCSRVSFFSGSVSAPASVSFYNASGVLLGAQAIPHIAQGSIYHLTDFSAVGISQVSLFITGRDWCAFDRFAIWS